MKVNADNIKSRKIDLIDKNGKSISPIISAGNSNEINNKDNNDKNYINDIMGNYVNDNAENNGVIKEKYNRNANIKNKKKNKNKNLTPSHFNVEQTKKEENKVNKDENEIYRNKFNILTIEKTNDLLVDKDINNYINNLEESPQNIFSIYNNKQNDLNN